MGYLKTLMDILNTSYKTPYQFFNGNFPTVANGTAPLLILTGVGKISECIVWLPAASDLRVEIVVDGTTVYTQQHTNTSQRGLGFLTWSALKWNGDVINTETNSDLYRYKLGITWRPMFLNTDSIPQRYIKVLPESIEFKSSFIVRVVSLSSNWYNGGIFQVRG